MKNVKSISAPKPIQSECNKTIEKLVETRLKEISKEVNFLKSLTEIKSSKKSMIKAKTKLKPKKVVQAEPIRVAQAEKSIKQQWVPKQIKQVTQQIQIGELMCDLSSGEPISGWVPKMN